MKYIGLDLGTRSLGISLSDITKTVATTYGTVHFEEKDYEKANLFVDDPDGFWSCLVRESCRGYYGRIRNGS